MKLYVKSEVPFSTSVLPEFVICVDPGQSTLGVYVINTRTNEDLMKSYPSKSGSVMGVSMGQTIFTVYDKTLTVFKEVCDFIGDSKDVVFICEQTTTSFTFSSGIITCLSCWITLFRTKFKGPVIFLSNKLTNYFLKKKKITNSASKNLILSQRPSWYNKIKSIGTRSAIYSHPCDAVLMYWAVYYEHLNFKTLRKLKLEIVQL